MIGRLGSPPELHPYPLPGYRSPMVRRNTQGDETGRRATIACVIYCAAERFPLTLEAVRVVEHVRLSAPELSPAIIVNARKTVVSSQRKGIVSLCPKSMTLVLQRYERNTHSRTDIFVSFNRRHASMPTIHLSLLPMMAALMEQICQEEVCR